MITEALLISYYTQFCMSQSHLYDKQLNNTSDKLGLDLHHKYWRLVDWRSTSAIKIPAPTPTTPPIIPNIWKVKSRNLNSWYSTSRPVLRSTIVRFNISV